MRSRFAIIVALVAGAFVTARLLVNDRPLEQTQLERIRTACPDCHGEVPVYTAAAAVHGRHSSFECGRCHSDVAALKTAGRLHTALVIALTGFVLLALAGLTANLWLIGNKAGSNPLPEPRSVRRFRGSVILVHWIHGVSFAVMLVTGAIMFYDLTGMDGGQLVRTIHKAFAVTFVAVPVMFSLIDPRATLGFLKEALFWDRDDLAWLRSSASFYFGRRAEMPRQGYLNGDQRLWQLVTVVTGTVLGVTGILMWFFKLKMSWGMYQGILLTHAMSFALAATMFLLHLYLTVLHPRFEESLSSMVDGKISPTYARQHFAKWYERTSGEKGSWDSDIDPTRNVP